MSSDPIATSSSCSDAGAYLSSDSQKVEICWIAREMQAGNRIDWFYWDNLNGDFKAANASRRGSRSEMLAGCRNRSLKGLVRFSKSRSNAPFTFSTVASAKKKNMCEQNQKHSTRGQKRTWHLSVKGLWTEKHTSKCCAAFSKDSMIWNLALKTEHIKKWERKWTKKKSNR